MSSIFKCGHGLISIPHLRKKTRCSVTAIFVFFRDLQGQNDRVELEGSVIPLVGLQHY